MSRLPFEQMMASLRPVGASSSKLGTMAGAVSVVMVSLRSHAAVWLRQARDVGHLLRRLLREQHEQLLGGDSADRGHAPNGGRLAALGGEIRPQEVDCLPVLVGQVDADRVGE